MFTRAVSGALRANSDQRSAKRRTGPGGQADAASLSQVEVSGGETRALDEVLHAMEAQRLTRSFGDGRVQESVLIPERCCS